MLYALALTESGSPAAAFASSCSDRVATLSLLFSITYTTGSFHSDARFSDSWNAPCLEAPSPKNDRTTWGGSPSLRLLTCAAKATPVACGIPWPTIPEVPRTPRPGSARGIEPPYPPQSPSRRP